MAVKRRSVPRPAAPSPARPARQARSRRTLARLLDAAEAVLERGGLEGATVPAIARSAGLSVGVVYRRFPDKDALLRAVFERFFERSRRANRAALDPAAWKGVATAEMARAVVTGMAAAYRRRPGLLRSLLLYSSSHPDPRFRRRADALMAETFREVERLFLSRPGALRHPDPPRAVRFAVLAIGSVLRSFVLSKGTAPGLPPGDALEEELTRLFAAYMGVARTAGKKRP